MILEHALAGWYSVLEPVFQKESVRNLGEVLYRERDVITPSLDNVFKAYELCPPDKLCVLIIGQDPYPKKGVANGLAFSTADNSIAPSLRVIFEELNRSGFKRTRTDLSDWANQGVMLLNTVLTTRIGTTFTHRNIGWETVVAATLQHINCLPQKISVLAWGAAAQALCTSYIQPADNRLILHACHPQAQNYNPARKFTGCDHFVRANQFIDNPVRWED